jgi:predicted permease
MIGFWQDVRYGVRIHLKSPVFAGLTVLILALGIGANIAIFSMIDAVLLRSLPARNPEQLVVLGWNAHKFPLVDEYNSFDDCGVSRLSGRSGCAFPMPILERMRSEDNGFSGVTGFAGPVTLNLSGRGPANLAQGEIVSGDYFSTLGVQCRSGRTLSKSDDLPSASPATVLSYGYWLRAFGGDSSILGRTILLNHVAFTVVGVAEPRFTGLSPGSHEDLWVTIAMLPRLGVDWGQRIEGYANWWMVIVGRLRPGIPISQAEAATTLLFRSDVLHGARPLWKVTDDPKIVLTPAQDGLIGERDRFAKMLYILMFAAGIILAAACANVASLILSRTTSRQNEISVRLAIGAGIGRVLQQIVTENLVLSIAGGSAGAIFAYWGIRATIASMGSDSSEQFPFRITPDWRLLSFAIAITTLTAICFSLAPALRSAYIDLLPGLKVHSTRAYRAIWRFPRFSLGNTLVVAQVALSIPTLIGAGLLVRTLRNLREVDPGFDARNVLLVEVEPKLLGYSDYQIKNLYHELSNRLGALPGVTSVSYSSSALLAGGSWSRRVHIAGQSNVAGIDVAMVAASAEFLRTLRIPLIQGRDFTLADFEERSDPNAASASIIDHGGQVSQSRSGGVESVLVNKLFVKRYFPNENALGKYILEGEGFGTGGQAFASNAQSRQWEIVGVVGDTKYNSLRREIEPIIYIPFRGGNGYFELRTSQDPRSLVPAVRQLAFQIAPDLPLSRIRTQTELIDEMLSRERVIARLSSFFAILAAVLAGVGLYAILFHEVTSRTHELGVRMAIGAQRYNIIRLVIIRSVVPTVIGAFIGIGITFSITNYMNSLLYGLPARDPVTIVAAVALMIVIAIAACYFPASYATGIDPIASLRHE